MAKGQTTFSHGPKVGKGGVQTTFSRGPVGKGGAVTQYGSGSASKSKPGVPGKKLPSGTAKKGPSTKSAGKAGSSYAKQGYSAGVTRGSLAI
jgi:hypothetical protein